MAKIKIDYDGISQQESSLNSVLSEFESLNSRLKNLSTTISDNWEGEAATAYAEMMAKYYVQANKMANVFESFKKYMNDVMNRYSSVDKECSNLINNSF